MAPVLSDLIGQYPILTTIASYLSSVDLLHLGLACRDFHALILSSTKGFEALRRDCLCDGSGLRRRLDAWRHYKYKWGSTRRILQDEEIEVRLFAVKCDEAGALPCVKCGINICEECREYPRVMPRYGNPPLRRPHLNDTWEVVNIMCLCDACDSAIEDQVHGEFLNELCDCDVYNRWICPKCAEDEERWTKEYYDKYTALESIEDTYDDFQEYQGLTKVMADHQSGILFHCVCGAYVPQEARPRCIWCTRKHRPEYEWYRELEQLLGRPLDDGSYPIYDSAYMRSYPILPYTGLVYQKPST
ncbi:uncharacterized protein F4822DRAFT_44831 [Hypoxylon trugodes]|uniref:uncharacterized protein n=1 Tax=Hypoxylon trugodes TaxID=326681 RepID=UPI002192752D|nr:uncharacterized protein F4822DRAFT_44831 [Hypoxylon trugodes]KAI1394305.1 hypothetical protein F4822DRAFT_44831 [Hypoxylon trugodes]